MRSDMSAEENFIEGIALLVAVLITIIGMMYFLCVDDWKVGRTFSVSHKVIENKLVMNTTKNILIYTNDGGKISLYKELVLPKGNYIIVGQKVNKD